MKKNIDIRNFALGTGGVSKTDEFSEKFQRGGVIFNPKNYVVHFICTFKEGFGFSILHVKLVRVFGGMSKWFT